MSEKIVQLNEDVIKGQSKELVRGSVEETLNAVSYTHLDVYKRQVLSRSKKIKRNFEKVLDEWRISVIIHIAVTQEHLS